MAIPLQRDATATAAATGSRRAWVATLATAALALAGLLDVLLAA